MKRIWTRVFCPSLAILVVGVIICLGFGIWLPSSFAKEPMLVGIASLSRQVSPILFGAFFLWALCDAAPKYWTVKRWLDGKGCCCSRCGGPTVQKWEKYKPRDLCLQCGFNRTK